LVSSIKALPVLKDTAKGMLASPVLAGGEREREGERLPFEESKIIPRSSRHTSYILEISVASPLGLACLKKPLADMNRWWGTPASYHSPKGQCLTPLHEDS
jgi:hypothetical protein